MTEEYRLLALSAAKVHAHKARAIYIQYEFPQNHNQMVSRQNAAESLNFWNGKVAYLEAAANETRPVGAVEGEK